jgi:transposase
MRAAMNAILCLLGTGHPWRYLPRDGLPRLAVYNIFRKFQSDGGLGGDLGRAVHGVTRADGPGG